MFSDCLLILKKRKWDWTMQDLDKFTELWLRLRASRKDDWTVEYLIENVTRELIHLARKLECEDIIRALKGR